MVAGGADGSGVAPGVLEVGGNGLMDGLESLVPLAGVVVSVGVAGAGVERVASGAATGVVVGGSWAGGVAVVSSRPSTWNFSRSSTEIVVDPRVRDVEVGEKGGDEKGHGNGQDQKALQHKEAKAITRRGALQQLQG